MSGINGYAIDRLLEEAIRGWQRACPWEVEPLKRLVRLRRDSLRNEKALGDTILYKGEIPERLHNAISYLLTITTGDRALWNWRHIPEIRNRFWRLFKIGRVNDTSEDWKQCTVVRTDRSL